MKPVPGKEYKIQDEDTLSQVAARAYGNSLYWPRIWAANQFTLKSGDPDSIYPGEIIIIPEIPELVRLRGLVTGPELATKAADDITIVIEDVEVQPVNARIIRTMDTMSDAWTCEIPYIPGDIPKLDNLLRPYGYPKASAYIGSNLLVRGLLQIVENRYDDSGSSKGLQGFSYTQEAVNSVLRADFEKNNVTLKQRCENVLRPLGIAVEVEEGLDISGVFSRVTANPTEKIADHLISLAKQRSALLSSTPEGQALITRARTTGRPVATLEEGKQGVGRFETVFDGTRRYNSYRAILQGPGGEKDEIAKDDNVPVTKFKAFSVNDITEGELLKAAEWERSKALGNALSFALPVFSWFDPNGELWRENTLVNIVSPSNNIPEGYIFLIRAVEYTISSEGRLAYLSVVPPQVYTGEPIKEPWL